MVENQVPTAFAASAIAIQPGRVVSSAVICTEHRRLTIRVAALGSARPGQFVHLCPSHWTREQADRAADVWCSERAGPLLRRAYSIAGLVRAADGVHVTIIFRIVGSGTRWLAGLNPGDEISVLGPLGSAFPIHLEKTHAWMVCGGVGLPPMLWLAEHLHAAGRTIVAFAGAQTAALMPLTVSNPDRVDRTGRVAELVASEFAAYETACVLSTDDGSLGFRGFVTQAFAAYHSANPVPSNDVVVYACGPEAMMRATADYCGRHSIRCYVCMERAMACGLRTCQSCVVPVRDHADPEGWRYDLCCADGPVFDAANVIWHSASPC